MRPFPQATPKTNRLEPVLYVEDKFDGIRAQLHRTRDRVEIFSRDLRRITDQFGDIVDRARGMSDEVILDGEIIAYEEGRRLTFFDLQKRLGRKDDGPDLFASTSSDVPVVFVAFDILWLNGQSLLRTPLRKRRQHMRGASPARAVSDCGNVSRPNRPPKSTEFSNRRARDQTRA